MLKYALAISLLSLAACAVPGGAVTSTETIDRTFTMVNTNTKSGDTRLVIAAKVENAGGKVKVCAATGAKGNSTFEGEWPQALLDRLRIYIGDDQITSQARWGSPHPGVEVLTGKTANCIVTDQAWKSGYDRRKARIRVGKIRLRA